MEINNHILIVDDNKSIHEDFRRVLKGSKAQRYHKSINALEHSLFGDEGSQRKNVQALEYRIDSAHSGIEALEMIDAAVADSDPYSLVFTDVRMAPGLDGVQLAGEIWRKAPFTEIVIVTAFSDYSFEEMTEKFGMTDRLIFLRKPFDSVTIKQLAMTLTKKWSLGRLARQQMEWLQMNRLVIDEMKDPVLWFGDDGRLFSVNEIACRTLGASREDMMRRTFSDICPEFSQSSWPRSWATIREQGSLLVESEFVGLDGRRLSVEVAISYMEYGGKEFGCAVARDVSERKQAEERLRMLEQRWRFLWENVPDAIVELDLDGRVKICNRMLGGEEPQAAVGRLLYDFLPERVHQGLRKNMERAVQTGRISDFELYLVTGGGAEVWWSIRIAPIRQEREIKGLLLIAVEISQRKQAEAALRRSEMRLAEAQRFAQIGNWEWDFSTGDIYWSDEMYRIFGYDKGDGAPTLDTFLQRTHPDDLVVLQDDLEHAMRRGKAMKGEYRLILPEERMRFIFVNAKVELDAQDQPLRLVGIAQDVSERRKVEEERASLETQLHHVQKMETLGTLAGGIAHDFNNILTPILGYTEMAMENAESDSRIRDDLKQALKAANRAKELVQQILVFSRNVEHERRPMKVAPVIEDAVKLIRAWVPTTIELDVRIEQEDCAVMADPTQIHQVLMNLCTNAYQALTDQGRISVRMSREQVDENLAKAHPKLGVGAYVKISVSDSGEGMDEVTLQRIFEPFFTTKSVGDGTGLGLSVVHGIVTGYGGAIIVDSEPGRGSTFHVYLPKVTMGEEVVAEKEEPVNQGRGRILFVDDEQIIAQMGREMLSRMGYDVVTRTDSREALALFQDSPDEFDLVITDQTMPHITGAQLASRLMQIRPGLPVILISGFSNTLNANDSKLLGISDFVSKPISAIDLNKAIRRVLSGGKS